MLTGDPFPTPNHLRVDDTFVSPELLVVAVTSTSSTSACPTCGSESTRVHSRYRRTLVDLPTSGRRLIIRLHVRRFRCDQPGCRQKLFCERLLGLVEPHARSTQRLAKLHQTVGLIAGGEAGARLSQHLGAPTSGDTILRRVKASSYEPEPIYRYVGIDDFALRKGHIYGTILVDLERGRVIELFEGRDGSAVEAWLKAHPGVEVITRDRASAYASAATAGAPQAEQVADRWHLLRNVLDALKGTVDRHHADIQSTAHETQNSSPESHETAGNQEESGPVDESLPKEDRPLRSSKPDRQQARRQRRLDLYDRVRALHKDGISAREIARQLGLNRSTVRRFIQADVFPERAGRVARRTTDSFRTYLRNRFEKGCHNASKLFDELKAMGFRGSYYAVRRQIVKWRSSVVSASPATAKPSTLPNKPSPRRVSWWLVCDDQDLKADERAFRDRLLERSDELRSASEMARAFRRMVRERALDSWDEWLTSACSESSVREIRNFAEGLKSDESAVRAALKYSWSNGPVEGQVGRLKLLKRSGYGRAGLELLRARVRSKA